MPAPGLVGWWQLRDGVTDPSTFVAIDSSGYGNNGALVGSSVVWITTGPNGGGLSFGGYPSHDSVRIPRATVLEPPAVTVSVWIKGPLTQLDFNTAVFIKAYQNDVGPVFISYSIQVNTDGNQANSHFATPSDAITAVNSVLDNTAWQNFVGTFDPTGTAPQKNYYLNGVLLGSSNDTTPIVYDTTSSGDLYIAANSDLSGLYKTYTGEMTDVRVYNRALSAAEVLAIFNGTDTTPTGPTLIRGPHRGSRMTPPYNP